MATASPSRRALSTEAPTYNLLIPPERYEIDSSRLNWPLDQPSGVPGLPDDIAIMPIARSHAAVLRMPCASGKSYTVRRDLVDVAKMSLVVVVTLLLVTTKIEHGVERVAICS